MKLQKQAKARSEERAFVIEGIKLFLEAPEELIKEVYLTEGFHAKFVKDKRKNTDFESTYGGDRHDKESLIRSKLKSISYEIVSDIVFERMADTKTPQGIICVVRQLKHELSNQTIHLQNHESPPLYLILEDLNDPGNIGTIFRTAEACGITAIIMNKACADIYNPKTIRATMGSIFRVPFIYTVDLNSMISDLSKHNINIYATSPECAETYDKCDYRGGTAFLIGSESHGLSKNLIDQASYRVTIPMKGEVESLNAACATAIILSEAARQRRM